MVSLVEHHVTPLTIEWYYDEDCDAIVVTTTTKAFTILHLGRLNATVEIPTTPTPVKLPEFLQPPLMSP